MNLKQFALQVIALRTAQKDYLKYHKAIDLLRVNKLELEVDKLAAEIAYGKEEELGL